MKLFKIVFFIGYLIFFSNSWAMGEAGKTLTLTLMNNSTHTLIFHEVKSGNIGNVFYVEPSVIFPNETATVTGIITVDVDLSGELAFFDEASHENNLIILDPRIFHAGQPIFNLKNAFYTTQLISRSFSKNRNARDLWVTDAKISVINSPNLYNNSKIYR